MNNRAAIFVFNAFLVVFPATLLFAQKPDHVSGHLLAQRTRRASAAAAGQAYARHGAKVISTIPQLNIDVLSLPEEAANGVAHSLGSSGLFNFVEKNGLARGSSVIPNDPSFPSQWHLTTINAPNAWSMTTGSSSVVIAMVDSGVNPTHPDLAARLVSGYSFLTSSTNTADVQGHGTATAGTAAAASNHGVGVAGVSWQNPIMPLVVLDSTDYATYSNIASAITYAADHGARVINISIGGSTPSSTLQSAVNYAWNKGSVVFASAMNSAGSAPYYPAACDNVVAVSATEPNDTLAAFSNYGSWIDLSAPGDSILTTDNSGGYSTWAGTSFSSPIAAATAALALTINPSLSAQALVNLLEQNSDDLGTPGWDQYFGFGRINAYRVTTAANQSISTDTIAPSVTILSPGSGATVSGVVAITGTATDNISASSQCSSGLTACLTPPAHSLVFVLVEHGWLVS